MQALLFNIIIIKIQVKRKTQTYSESTFRFINDVAHLDFDLVSNLTT